MADQAASPQQTPLRFSCSRHFLPWLEARRLSLALTTYQSSRLFLIGLKEDGSLSVHERLFDRAMGLHATPQRLHLATRHQIWQFDNALAPDTLHEGYDRLFVPRRTAITGDLDVHDLAVDADGRPVFVNTLYSCVATTSERYSFEPLWRPPFISKLLPEDRCHLNGLALRAGRPAYVTAVGRCDVAGGWRAHRHDGGCVIDVDSGEAVATGLSMPHSPRWYRDRLWLLNSGTGELGCIDARDGRFEALAFCPGYARGLAFDGDHAVIGLSQPRETADFSGLALDERLRAKNAAPACGVRVIDLRTGVTEHWLDIEGVVTELYDVQLIGGARRPMALGLKSDEISRLIAFEEDGRPRLHRVSTPGDTAPASASAPPAPAYAFPPAFTAPAAKLTRDLDALTFPRLSQLARDRRLKDPLHAVIATAEGRPVGMVVAEIEFATRCARLLCWFVLKDHRGRGVGKRLLERIERTLLAHGADRVEASYRADWPGVPAIEHLLHARNWQPPRRSMLLCSGEVAAIAGVDWMKRCTLPAGFEIFPWAELRADERVDILRRQQSSPWFAPVLSPFQEEHRIDFSTSVGLRHKGEVVGWMITHRVAPDTLQYTSLFVRRDLQRLGRALALLAEAIKRHLASGVPRGICQVGIDNERMAAYMRKRIEPHGIKLAELRCAGKHLAADRGAPAQRRRA